MVTRTKRAGERNLPANKHVATGGTNPFKSLLENDPTNNYTLVKETNEVEECKTSFLKFCQRYLSHWFYSPFCDFHYDIIHLLEDLTFNKSKRKVFTAVASPRGHAKSTLVSKAYPLWLACYRHAENILMLADTIAQCEDYLDDIKGEFEVNELLIEDFGNLVSKRRWKAGEIITANGVHIVCKGTGSKIRGVSKNGKRPDVIFMDDLENDDFVESATIRKRLRSWLNKAVIPSAHTDCKFFLIGTVLHEDSLLNNLLHSSEYAYWKRFFYQAVEEFSPSPLWDDWEQILMGDDDDIDEQAYAFYQSHREEMLQGVKALWMDKSDDYYYDMMVLRASDPDAFSSEYQNIAISPETQVFNQELIDEATYDELPCEIKEIYIGVDPSLGKRADSDLSSICVVGRGTDNILYALEIDARRRKAEDLMEDMYTMAFKYKDYKPMINLESNVFQYFFYEQSVKMFADRGFYININPVRTSTDKELRLKSLVPKFKQGYLKIHRRMKHLKTEMLTFPRGKTDDILDSLFFAVDGVYVTSTGAFGSISISNKGKRQPRIYTGRY